MNPGPLYAGKSAVLVSRLQQARNSQCFRKMGQIDLIIGPMFAGKTTEWIRRIRRATFGGRAVLLVKHKIDVRWDSGSMVMTHCGSKLQAHMTASSLAQVETEVENRGYDLVAIDEGQFFPDLAEVADRMANKGGNITLHTSASPIPLARLPSVDSGAGRQLFEPPELPPLPAGDRSHPEGRESYETHSSLQSLPGEQPRLSPRGGSVLW